MSFVNQFSEIFKENWMNVATVKIVNCIDPNIGIMLRNKVDDNCENIFLINFWPSSIVVSSIRKHIQLCKIIQVVHDLPWLTIFNGEVSCFISSLQDKFENIKDSKLKKFLYYSTLDSCNAFNNVDKIVCLCTDTYNLLANIYGVDYNKLTIIRNAMFDFNKLDNLSIDKGVSRIFQTATMNLLFIGRPTISKGWDRIISIASEIKETMTDCKIICAGSEKFKCFIPHHIKEVFEDVGILTHTEILYLIKNSNGILLFSRHEQCSYTGIEAMMMAKEIFIFNGFGIQNMFNHTNSHKIKNLYELMKSRDNKKGCNARLDYLRHYSPTIFKESYLKLFISVTS